MTPEQFEDIDLDVMEQDLNEFGRGIFDKKQIQQLIDYARYLRAGEKLIQHAQEDPTLAKIIRKGWPSDAVRDAAKYGVWIVMRCSAGYECQWKPTECKHEKVQHLLIEYPKDSE